MKQEHVAYSPEIYLPGALIEKNIGYSADGT